MSRHDVLAELRAYHARGEPANLAYVTSRDARMSNAVQLNFPSWDDAVAAAGLPPQRLTTPWDRDRVLQLLTQHHQAGRPTSVAALVATEPSYQEAAKRLFGSHVAALRAADLPAPRDNRPRHWTALTAELRAFADGRTELTTRDLSLLFRRKVLKAWKTWDAACAAIGITPSYLRRPRLTHAMILADFRALAQDRSALTIAEIPGRLQFAAQRLGGLDAACTAAGLTLVRTKVVLSDDQLRAALQALVGSARTVTRSQIPTNRAATLRRRWGSLQASCIAAGLTLRAGGTTDFTRP